jgi:tyrosine-protein phosphatase YwqE
MFESFFGKKNADPSFPFPIVDLHSHLLPGIDDGSANIEESITMLKAFQEMGFKKVITTPHITEGYENTPEIIRGKLAEVQSVAEAQGLEIKIEAAAEYFLDEKFIALINEDKEIITLGKNNHVLVETAFMTRPIMIVETVKLLQSKGYRPIYAHPERYQYLQGNWDTVKKIYDSGILFQINAMSLVGYYDNAPRKLAERLIDEGMVSFIGSDCHKPKHTDFYKKARESKYYHKCPILFTSLFIDSNQSTTASIM